MEQRGNGQGIINRTRHLIGNVGAIFESRKEEHPDNALFEEQDGKLSEQYRADLLSHAGACMSEIEYVLGISDRDPHPDHPILFDETASDASRLL